MSYARHLATHQPLPTSLKEDLMIDLSEVHHESCGGKGSEIQQKSMWP